MIWFGVGEFLSPGKISIKTTFNRTGEFSWFCSTIAVLDEELLNVGEENQIKSMEFEIPNKTTNVSSNDNGKPRINHQLFIL